MGGRLALLIALGIDNVGSGLFLPLSVLYGIQVVMRATGALWRTTAMRLGYVIYVAWALASMAAVLVPVSWLPAYLLATVALFAVGPWLPWLVVAVAATVSVATMPYLARSLPRDAVRGDYGRIAST